MKEFIILIIMFFADPMYKGKDSVSIKSYQGKPLAFSSLDKCEKWVWDDLENLKAYAKTGIDLISTSAPMTRSPWIDFSMRFETS